MNEFIGGIRNITPSYPVRPVQPVNKDSETGEEKQKKQQPPPKNDHDDDEDKPLIDEHV